MRKNWLIYGIVLVVLFSFIYLRDSSVTYTAFYAAVLLPVVSYLLAVITKRHLYFTETLHTDFVAKNEKTEYKVKIENHGFLPCFLIRIKLDFAHIGLDSDLDDVYLSIAPRRARAIRTNISGSYRGIYEVGTNDIAIYDFLGLFKLRPKYTSQARLTIAPGITLMPNLINESTDDGETTTKRNLPGSDLSVATELRDYLPTDSYRQIHWKATAKKGKLMSKNPQEILQPQSVFLVDNRRISKSLLKTLETEDQLIGRVVSMMSHCHNLGYRMSVQTLRTRFLNNIEQGFTTDFNRLYHEIATLPFGEFGGLERLLSDYFNAGTHSDHIFIFTQDINEQAVKVLQDLRLVDNQITLFMFGTLAKNMQRRLESIGIEVKTHEKDEI